MSLFQQMREATVRKIVERLSGCSLVEVELVDEKNERKQVLSFFPKSYRPFIRDAKRLSLHVVLTKGNEKDDIWVGLK